MDTDRDWLKLVAHLDSWALSATAVGPDRIEVKMRDGRRVYVQLTVDNLDDLFVAFGAAEAFDVIAEQLDVLPPGADTLVYTQYWVEPG